jgi:Zn-dependent protease
VLALGCLTAFAIGDGARPFLGTLAAWGAFINLFNLLPLFPLDGGRLIASLAHASRKGVPIVAASLVLGGAGSSSPLDLLRQANPGDLATLEDHAVGTAR